MVCLRSRVHWLHCEALCAEPLVLPSLPDQCFLHGMILLSWRPKNWKIKKRRCLHGRSERERERSTACMCVDWRTDTRAWHSVCSRLLICSHCDIIELAVLSCLATVSLLLLFFFFFCFCITSCVMLCRGSHVITSAPILHLLHWVEILHLQSRLYVPVCVDGIRAVQVCRRSISYLAAFMPWTQDGERTITSPVVVTKYIYSST